jgi:putative heme degradation protein
MSQKLGYATIRAEKVVRGAKKEIENLLAERAESLEKYISSTQEMLNERFFHKLFRRPPVTRDQAIKWIEDDDGYEYMYHSLTPEFISERQQSLQTLIDVGNDMMRIWPQAEMELAIEVADWLVLR